MLDVCLIVEGSYPYSPAGAGRWVSDHVEGLSTVRFGVVHVGAGRDLPREPVFPVPDNVEQIVEVFPREPLPVRRRGLGALLRARLRRLGALIGEERRAALAELDSFYERLLAGDVEGLDAVMEIAAGAASGGGPGTGAHLESLLRTEEAWELFAEAYEEHAAGRGPRDRVAAWEETNAPLLRLLRTPVPAAAVYHTISSGTAGLLGALAAARTGAPLLLTEPTAGRGEAAPDRGSSPAAAGGAAAAGPGFRRREFVRRTVYRRADEIACFSEVGLRAAIRAGAPAERCRVIPDGIDVERLGGLRRKGRTIAEKDVALIVWAGGSLSAAKDAKTFLRAAKLLVERLDLVEIVLAGSFIEDPVYYRECLLQTQMLSIDRIVRFAGGIDLAQFLEEADCVALTGATEGAPMALLAAMAAGVPSVATDAGACREILEGRSAEDRALGPAGVICPIGDHEAIAEAVIRCVRDRPFRDRLVAAGEARADRYYRREELQAVYLETYERLRALRSS